MMRGSLRAPIPFLNLRSSADLAPSFDRRAAVFGKSIG
jgi:hypothetical protein